MLKRFFISLLGSVAGIWISLGIVFLIGVLFAFAIGRETNEDKVSVDRHSILYINLTGEITERKTPASLVSEIYGTALPQLALDEITSSIRAAAENDDIDGIFIEGNLSLAGTTTRLDIVEALKSFKKSGKWIVAYADSYSQGDYFIASAADELYVNPIGSVDIHGLASTTYLFKNLLDKAGVDVQIIKVGTYKSAVEPFTLTEISEANRRQQTLFVTNIWDNIATVIAKNRNVYFSKVDLWAENLVYTAEPAYYTKSGIVDGLRYRHEVVTMLKEKCSIDSNEDLRLITPAQYCVSVDMPHSSDTGNNIAVLYAVGDIVDAGNEGIVGPRVVAQIEQLIEDDDNDALVLRVNSGGGSAFASEQIWEALCRYKETGRPFYVSMGDYAASGGYYISCCADRIFAQPTTLTGSIGIFGMIPCFNQLLSEHIGVTQSTVMTNPNANFISLTSPMNEVQLAKMQEEINRGYETFVDRCAKGRHLSVDSIKSIAEGRVWDGGEALKIGLIDEIGNLDDVIAAIAEKLEFDDKYTVTVYPKLKMSLWDRIDQLQNGEVAKSVFLKNELGDDYHLLNKIRHIKSMNRIQARMDEVTIQ